MFWTHATQFSKNSAPLLSRACTTMEVRYVVLTSCTYTALLSCTMLPHSAEKHYLPHRPIISTILITNATCQGTLRHKKHSEDITAAPVRPEKQFPTTTQPTSHKIHRSQEINILMPGTPLTSGALPCQLGPCSSPRADVLSHTEPNTLCQFAGGCPRIMGAATLQLSGHAALVLPTAAGTTCSSC